MLNNKKSSQTEKKVALIAAVISTVVSAGAIVVAAIIQGYFQVEAAKVKPSEPTKPAQTLQSVACPTNSAGYVIVHATSENHCFKGIGVMNYLINDVMSIETGSYRVSWLYRDNGREVRAPSNSDWHVHVCSGKNISHAQPVQLLRIFVADTDLGKCTDTVS